MKAGWNLVQLGELTEPSSPITYGVIKPGEEGDVLFVRGGDISDGNIRINQLRTITKEISEQYSRTLLKGGELLMCLVGQPGQVAVAPHNLAGANIARQVGLIRLQPNLNAEFIKYFLQSPDGQQKLGAQTGGSVQQVINLSDLRTIEIPLPSAAEQQRIVAILDEALAAITAARTNAEQNRQNARALFESYLQSVFSQRGDEWVEKPLEDLIESNVIGLTKNSREQGEDKTWPYVKMNNITRENNFDLSSFTCVDATVEEVSKFSLRNGDFLFNTRNSYELVGKSCIYESSSFDTVLYNNNIMRIRFRHDIYARFILFAFSFKDVVDQLNAMKSGTTNVSAIYFKDLKSLVIPIPPISEQKKLSSKLAIIATETKRLESLYQRKIAALDELKQSLLQQAFSGKL